MMKKARLFNLLAFTAFFINCGASISNKNSAQTVNSTEPRVGNVEKRGASFTFSTLYWAHPRSVAAEDWHAVFGGTVVQVKKEKQELSEDLNRKYVGGAIKIERIFLNLPSGEPISIGDEFYGEDFENLKKGDRVIVFVNGFYEKDFVRIKIDGTDSALGFKVKNWNEPVVAVLEKAAACGKIEERWAEGHERDFRAKFYDCRDARNQTILENADVWKRYDPKGFDELLERRKFWQENENQNRNEN